MVAANITAYGIGLFIHILAVVVALGPGFSYGIIFSVVPNHPRSAPVVIEAMQRVDRYIVTPGLIVILAAGIYLMSKGSWDASEGFITIGFIAIIALFGLQHGFFNPQMRKARELAERDLKGGEALSEEFQEIGRRLGTVGPVTGLIVVVTIFFMVVKP